MENAPVLHVTQHGLHTDSIESAIRLEEARVKP
jgi:hypothetical protein